MNRRALGKNVRAVGLLNKDIRACFCGLVHMAFLGIRQHALGLLAGGRSSTSNRRARMVPLGTKRPAVLLFGGRV